VNGAPASSWTVAVSSARIWTVDGLQWVIGIDSWIIQDGNYADFATGDRVEFAVEFAPLSPAVRTDHSPVGAQRIEPNLYDLTAEVVAISEGVTVLDCGILMYGPALSGPRRRSGDPRAPEQAVGDVVSLRAYVGIDPFKYFEDYAHRPGVPAMIYSWSVDEIRLDTTPWVRQGRASIRRDRSRPSSAVIERTDALSDDDGRASYMLACTLSHDAPTHTRSH
jgi:hypothetical protein